MKPITVHMGELVRVTISPTPSGVELVHESPTGTRRRTLRNAMQVQTFVERDEAQLADAVSKAWTHFAAERAKTALARANVWQPSKGLA